MHLSVDRAAVIYRLEQAVTDMLTNKHVKETHKKIEVVLNRSCDIIINLWHSLLFCL